jgi:alkylhydroperoxidase/carboxymuconolactone decarboxylase family protein YurZ
MRFYKLAAALLAAGILSMNLTFTEAAEMEQNNNERKAVKVVQTAGRDMLGEIAPEFARLNDDVLFGEVWSRNDKLSLRDRSMVTVATLVAKGMGDSFACQYQMQEAKKNGVTREEMAEILTHQAFYAGWPNVWAAFNSMKKAYVEEGAAK